MKKIIAITSLLYCFIVVFAHSINAFEFTKSAGNPLPISYTQDYVYNFQAHIYKEGNLYKGIISVKKNGQDNHSLVAIESVDGTNWRMTKEVLASQEKNISNPRLVIDKEGNKKIFFVQTDGPELYRIYSVDCDSDLNCSREINFIIGPDADNQNETHGYFAPYVLYLDKYYLFYGTWGGEGFKIRMAYSETLSNWQRCPNDLIDYGADGPFPYIENNILYLFYHESDSSGIKLAKTTLPLDCSSVFEDLGYLIRPSTSYDRMHLIYPSVIKENNGLKLYYVGLGSNYNWSLNLACTNQACLIQSPTPTVISTPTPVPKTPIVIIPGFLASWNGQALIHNQAVSVFDWKLATFVKEYNGLINTFKNIGYEENKNLFIFAYDWRKSVMDIAGDLDIFLNRLIANYFQPTVNFQIVGHSLGGLVGRIYVQKFGTEKINKLITIATPHQGIAQVYKPVEAGEIDRDNSWLWLAEKLVLMLNKNSFETDRQTINDNFPVLKDLLPTYSFLKIQDGSININDMNIRNDLLNTYNQNLTQEISYRAIASKLINTISGYRIIERNTLDRLLNLYPDGRPIENIYETGDGVVPFISSGLGNDINVLNYNHGEIVYKKEAIKEILNYLTIPYSEDQIVEGQGTVISPSLIFLIKSPAKMKVEFDNDTYIEDEGIILIPDARSGSYNLKVRGIDKGKYEVVIGQISENNDIWNNISGEIVQSPADSQTDSYTIKYNNQNAVSISPAPSLAPTLIPTTTQQTTTLQSKEDIVPITQVSTAPEVLGISSNEEETTTQVPEPDKEIDKINLIDKTSIWKKIIPIIMSLLTGAAAWIFKKKIFKK